MGRFCRFPSSGRLREPRCPSESRGRGTPGRGPRPCIWQGLPGVGSPPLSSGRGRPAWLPEAPIAGPTWSDAALVPSRSPESCCFPALCPFFPEVPVRVPGRVPPRPEWSSASLPPQACGADGRSSSIAHTRKCLFKKRSLDSGILVTLFEMQSSVTFLGDCGVGRASDPPLSPGKEAPHAAGLLLGPAAPGL